MFVTTLIPVALLFCFLVDDSVSGNILCRINRNCTGIECPAVNCTGSDTPQPPKCGECCSRCGPGSANSTSGLVGKCLIKANCSAVTCPVLECPGNLTIVPPKCGECCSSCGASKTVIGIGFNIKANCTGDNCTLTTASLNSTSLYAKLSINGTLKNKCTGEDCSTSSSITTQNSLNSTQSSSKLSDDGDSESKTNCSSVTCPPLECAGNSTLTPAADGDCCPSCQPKNATSTITTTTES
ncbi:uncharacterized protein LOC143204973 isoform X1 [Rhynchophorus ferrugineus]|uniref:uncharacterized protein LOC143204973 isoform X1 n=1 Tax=Rhynchophorus ferrugineus TaxID=354439 RepID=UPI003FCD0282